MKIETNLYQNGKWQHPLDGSLDSPNTLIVAFSTPLFQDIEEGFKELSETFPDAVITGCSTTGEIYHDQIFDGTLAIAIAKFEKTQIVVHSVAVQEIESSHDAGVALANSFSKEGLKSLYVLGDGLAINASELVKGFNDIVSKNVIVTGGMASDNGQFEETWVFIDRKPSSYHASAIGFYGEDFHVDYASEGGWNRFGLERKITSCDPKSNTIYTIDNKPILELYKNYMGEHAQNLPASGLEFPFLVIDEEDDIKIRSLLSANEESQSITVYGDIKEGNKIVFLKGSPDYIVNGAQKAAQKLDYPTEPILALTVSCVGRRSVLKEFVEDEIEIVSETLESNVSQIGFYSYGELSTQASGKCAHLNQTMTLSLIWES